MTIFYPTSPLMFDFLGSFPTPHPTLKSYIINGRSLNQNRCYENKQPFFTNLRYVNLSVKSAILHPASTSRPHCQKVTLGKKYQIKTFHIGCSMFIVYVKGDLISECFSVASNLQKMRCQIIALSISSLGG